MTTATRPTVCCDLIPNRGSWVRGAGYQFDTLTRVLRLETDRRSDRRYVVAELAIDRAAFGGRAFQLKKIAAGTDPEADGYTCLVAADGRGHSCECRGWLRWNKP